jgi:hypothetical protein
MPNVRAQERFPGGTSCETRSHRNEAHFYRGESIAQAKREVGHLMSSLTGIHSKLGIEVIAGGA